MGWENVMHCEIDPFCNRVMNHHFPNSYQHEDIRTTNFTIWRGRIDLLTGGFPCQPYSAAGKRQGTADNRHLWPEMLRAIREIQPTWIVPENVRGLINWSKGMVFEQVQIEMEAEGYEVLPFLLPACGVNAPHRRDRIWLVAYANNIIRGTGTEWKDWEEINNSNSAGIIADTKSSNRDISKRSEDREKEIHTIGFGWEGHATNAECFRLPVRDDEQDGRDAQPISKRLYGLTDWQDFPTQSPVCGRNDGLSGELADITVPSKKHGTRVLTGKQAYGRWRKESIKSLGNAIVPQVAFQIFKSINQYLCTSSASPQLPGGA